MEEGMRQSRGEREEEQNRYQGREEQRGWEAREERGGRQGGYMGLEGSREGRYRNPGSESWEQGDYERGRRNMGAYGEERFGESGRFGGRERMGGPYGQREFSGQGERQYGMYENRGQYGGEFGGGYGGGYGQSGQFGGGRFGNEQWGRGQWGSGESGQPYGQGRAQWGGREYDQSYGQGRGQWAGSEYDQSYGQGRGQWGRGEYGPQFGQGRAQWGRGQWGERQGSADEGWGSRRFGQQEGRFGQQEGGPDMGDQLSQFGGAMAGRVRRMFRSPKGYKRSDDRIREDICDQLSQEAQLDPGDIEVSVSNGEVTLSGTVPERYMKWQAEQLIDNVSGVNEIHNQLRIKRQDMSMGSTGSQQTGGMTGTPANTQSGTRSQSRS